MRVNIYAEEMTDRVELVTKEVEGSKFTAVRFYLELPATIGGHQYQGPFIHRPGDDDSSAVTFWGKRDLRPLLRRALAILDEHYAASDPRQLKLGHHYRPCPNTGTCEYAFTAGNRCHEPMEPNGFPCGQAEEAH